jgi:hypothetical protein
MKTKQIFIIASIIFAISLVFSACNKYEEGPSFTLLSATKRIEGTWVLTETKVNDTVLNLNDIMSLLANMETDSLSEDIPFDLSTVTINSIKATFDKDGTGNFKFNVSAMGLPFTQTEEITWAFDDEKENVAIVIMEETQSFEILRLTKKELWIRRVETTDGVTTTLIMKMEKEED